MQHLLVNNIHSDNTEVTFITLQISGAQKERFLNVLKSVNKAMNKWTC